MLLTLFYTHQLHCVGCCCCYCCCCCCLFSLHVVW